MILVENEIRLAKHQRKIKIYPYDEKYLRSNSYEMHLGNYLEYYLGAEEFDVKTDNKKRKITIPEKGYLLEPNTIYLCKTQEKTETTEHVAEFKGIFANESLGISIVAANGEYLGFNDHWTLGITVMRPTRIYAGMPIGEIVYHNIFGDITKSKIKSEELVNEQVL